MIILGSVVGIVALGTMIASAASAAEINKAKGCTTFPMKAYNMSTLLSVFSAMVVVAGVSVAGIGAYKHFKGKVSFYRFDF